MGQVTAVCEFRCLCWAGHYSYLQSPSVYADGFYKTFPKARNIYPLGLTYLSFFFFFKIHLFSYLFRLCCVFAAARPFLVAASTGCSSLRCLGFSLQ